MSLKYHEKKGAGDNFLGLTLENLQTLKYQLSQKNGAEFEYFANFFCDLVLLMYSIRIIIFGWKLCSKLKFMTIFLNLANFATFHDHTKENADVTKMMANLRLIFRFSKSACLGL